MLIRPLDSEIDNERQADETILWSGRPLGGIRFRMIDLFLIPFGLFWCGFALFYEWALLTMGNVPWIFKLLGIPFIVLGLFMVFGRIL